MCIEVDEFKFFQIAKNIFTNLNFDIKKESLSPTKDDDLKSSYSDSSFENLQILRGNN